MLNYINSIIDYKISLSPNEINNNINNIILEKVKEDIGDKCYKDGYILKD